MIRAGMRVQVAVVAASLMVLWLAGLAHAQGLNQDGRGNRPAIYTGHCERDGVVVLACWNVSAGRLLAIDAVIGPEPMPNLQGWDFRINLPHVRFQQTRPDFASPPTLAGVIEDSLPLYAANGSALSTFEDYGHQNNAIWLLRVDKSTGRLVYKVLPSRRTTAGVPENIENLTDGWRTVGSGAAPALQEDRPAVAVLGQGIGNAVLYVVARATGGDLHFTRYAVDDTTGGPWSEPWTPLNLQSSTPPVLIPAFDGKLALATHTGVATSRLEVRFFDPQTGIWSDPVRTGVAEIVAPQLVWDGTALSLFYRLFGRLQHTALTDAQVAQWPDPVEVASIQASSFHAMAFNQRLHVAIKLNADGPPPHAVYYTASTSAPGQPSRWAAASHVGFQSRSAPRIVAFYENIYVVGVNDAGQVVYSRKDPNRLGNDITGGQLDDKWLEKGTVLDQSTPGVFFDLEVLRFNTDVYLAANKAPAGDADRGTYLINFSRAAMKQLLTQKWGTALLYGGGTRTVVDLAQFATVDAVTALGNFDGDAFVDVVKFAQQVESGVGPAPVYVVLNKNGSFQTQGAGDQKQPLAQLWHKFFALKGEIPMVGDFNGDGFDDIVSFTQQEQKDANGTVIGPAVVWVSLNEPDPASPSGRHFATSQIWHKFFSLKGEIPAVGDFNGDGKDDIVSFTQHEQKDANGTVIGPAVVWVSLSTGAAFQTSQIWHKFFSLQGEIPMVGDFNGDGKDDIVSFVRKQQLNGDGSVLGAAPVWVSRSDGATFQTSHVWKTTFALPGEIPQVADMNMDGKDDIVAFAAGTGAAGAERLVYVANSFGNFFGRSVTWHSDFAGPTQVRLGADNIVRSPVIGGLEGNLKRITGRNEDVDRALPTLVTFGSDSRVRAAYVMSTVPYAAGAPWENYKWFPEKALAAAQFPEWLYEQGPNHCISVGHRFRLSGAAGSGGANEMTSSVRAGGRAGHILQELGHSIFANCIRADKDHLGIYDDLFVTPIDQGGFGAGMIADLCVEDSGEDTYDCRSGESSREAKGEHVFLGLMVNYRLDGDAYRQRMRDEPNSTYRRQLAAAYDWLKANWFDGAEFTLGETSAASLYQDGVQCLTPGCVDLVTVPILSGAHVYLPVVVR